MNNKDSSQPSSTAAVDRWALLSVSDKTGIVELAQQLHQQGIQLLSTGGTASLLRDHSVPITEVADYTGFPEMMGGRVKTLHPKIHGGILGRREVDSSVMQAHGIDAIDFVVVNLYPFEQAVARDNCSLQDAIENIDIGGPAMVRSAAKNHASVSIVTDPADYQKLIDALQSDEGVNHSLRFDLAVKAFEHTARYDGMIASYFGSRLEVDAYSHKHPAAYSRTLNLQLNKKMDLRYGENPHQSAAFYTEREPSSGSIAVASQLQGKELSYNNIADTDAALQCVQQFDESACVIVKHANPCGVAVRSSQLAAYDAAYATDPTSAFGGIIAFNRALDADTARSITERQFVEVIIAPVVSPEAREVLQAKANVRVLECGEPDPAETALHFSRVAGGLLVQQRDNALYAPGDLKVVSKLEPSAEQMVDVKFAWKVAKFVKSNAIVYCKDQQTVGVGAGQMSRVYSARVAAIKAADENLVVQGSVMASDAFFPFRDGIDAAAGAGVSVVVQPGGSRNDEEVIAAADEHGMAMVFTGMRHFRH